VSVDQRRPLSVAWDWIELVGSAAAGAAWAEDRRAGDPRLLIPRGYRLDYRLDLEPGSRLVLAKVEPEPRALIVRLELGDGREHLLRLDQKLDLPLEIDLGIEHLSYATLSLLGDSELITELLPLTLERPEIRRPKG
jgi:hypothetical protein